MNRIPDPNSTPTAADMNVRLSKFSIFTAGLLVAATAEAVYRKVWLRRATKKHFDKITG